MQVVTAWAVEVSAASDSKGASGWLDAARGLYSLAVQRPRCSTNTKRAAGLGWPSIRAAAGRRLHLARAAVLAVALALADRGRRRSV